MRLKTLCLPAILPVLALSATQLVAQPQEARLDMGIRVQHTLPEGWQANLDGYRLTFWAEDQSLRALFIESPSPLLQGSLHEVGEPGFGPVHTRQAVLMNEAVTLYRLEMSRFSLGAAQAHPSSTANRPSD